MCCCKEGGGNGRRTQWQAGGERKRRKKRKKKKGKRWHRSIDGKESAYDAFLAIPFSFSLLVTLLDYGFRRACDAPRER
jgi:hypothetical protein